MHPQLYSVEVDYMSSSYFDDTQALQMDIKKLEEQTGNY